MAGNTAIAYQIIFGLISSLTISIVESESSTEERHCYECTGFQCMQNPADPNLYPGRVKCHEVMDYCATHVRYTPSNKSLEAGQGLKETDYSPISATRSCAKVWLGNTCRRDWLGKPEITCITTCETDFCNCDTRSPPPQMFGTDGKVLHEAPSESKYSISDTLSCSHMAGVPGFKDGSNLRNIRIDDDYTNENEDAERRRVKATSSKKKSCVKTKNRRCSDATVVALNLAVICLGLLTVALN